MNIDDQELTLSEKLSLTDIGDLAEICKSKCGTKYISVLLYMSLLGVSQYQYRIGVSVLVLVLA